MQPTVTSFLLVTGWCLEREAVLGGSVLIAELYNDGKTEKSIYWLCKAGQNKQLSLKTKAKYVYRWLHLGLGVGEGDERIRNNKRTRKGRII